MRAFFKYLVAFGALCFPAIAQAGDPPISADTCLSPMKPDDPPVVMRDIRFTVTPDKRTVIMQMCVASSEKRGIAQYSVNLGVFQKNGAFLATGGNTFNNIPPLNGGPNKPATIIMFNTSAVIDPKLADELLPQTVVQGGWSACKDGPPAPCVADTNHTISFLLPVTITPQAKRGGRR